MAFPWDKVPTWLFAAVLFILSVLLVYLVATGTKVHWADGVFGFHSREDIQAKVVWGPEPKSQSATQGPPNAAVDRRAECPNGGVVTGIEIQYGGTCDRACDKDGVGVVKRLILVCSNLRVDVPVLAKGG